MTFKADPQIFGDITFSFDTLSNRLRELAFLNPGTTITIIDERDDKEHTFFYEGGIIEFVKFLNGNKSVLHPDPIYFRKEKDGVLVEVAIQYNDGYNEQVFSFVNNINTIEGGTHVTGFRSALTRVINDYVKKKELLKDGRQSDRRRRAGRPLHGHLGQSPQSPVRRPDQNQARQQRSRRPDQIRDGRRALRFLRRASADREQSLRKNDRGGGSPRSRPESPRTHPPQRRAGWGVPARQARAIVPTGTRSAPNSTSSKAIPPAVPPNRAATAASRRSCRCAGKIINVEKSRLVKVLANEEIRTMITAIGTGVGEEDFNLEKARYKRIIIMTDADVDGAHIRTLLLTFFYRQMTPLIKEGYIYIAQPPLFKIKKEKKELYLDTDEALDQWLLAEGLEEVELYPLSKGKWANRSKPPS